MSPYPFVFTANCAPFTFLSSRDFSVLGHSTLQYFMVDFLCFSLNLFSLFWQDYNALKRRKQNFFELVLSKIQKSKKPFLFSGISSFNCFLCQFVFIWRYFLLNSMSNFQMNFSFIFIMLQFTQNNYICKRCKKRAQENPSS